MRAYALIALGVMGCSASDKSPGDDVEPDPKGWTITVDMSATDRFVQPATSTTWPVSGEATATEGLASVAVGGMTAPLDGGAFTASVAAAPGLTRVSVLATDDAGHTRKGDRTLLAATFLPEGAHNPAAASLVTRRRGVSHPWRAATRAVAAVVRNRCRGGSRRAALIFGAALC